MWPFTSVRSVAQLCPTQSCPTLCNLWTAALQASLSITNTQSLPKLLSIESVMPSNHLILCHPLLLSPSIFPSIRVSFSVSWLFASGSQSIGVSTSTSVLPMNTQDWSPLEWTGGSPCSPRDSQESSPTPQFKSINSSALSLLHIQHVQLSHPYMTTGKTIALTMVGKLMDLCWQSNVSAF